MTNTLLNQAQTVQLLTVEQIFKQIMYKNFSMIVPSEALNNAIDRSIRDQVSFFFESKELALKSVIHAGLPTQEYEDVKKINEALKANNDQSLERESPKLILKAKYSTYSGNPPQI